MKYRCSAIALLFVAFLLSSCVSPPSDTRSAEEIFSAMSIEEKVAQLFVICPEQLDKAFTPEDAQLPYDARRVRLSVEMKKTLKDYPVGGFIFFGKNIENKAQLKKLTSDLSKACAISPILAVDEEGGRVARLAKTELLGIENLEPMEAIGEAGDVGEAWNAGAYIGGYLREYGFTMDFAPVADVNTNPQNIVIGSRSFGSEPVLVSQMDAAFLAGLHSQGIKGCLKHFPGHGDTKGDTHDDYVAVTKTWEEILDCELVPFRENFVRADSVMVAHVTFTDVDSSYPASLSKSLITEKLRGELGYDGIVLTDALNMGAIEKNYGSAEAALLAFEAGNDILLMPYHFFDAYDGVLKAVNSGRISEERLNESVMRILHLKGYEQSFSER
ncbi:MAG: hypothetical protein IJ158_10275 [Treponema sp.]|nr:hypothetical protein [Treponema sp.]